MFEKDTLKLIDQKYTETYSGFYFGICHEPKGNELRLVKGTHSCRDGFGGTVREYITSSSKEFETDKTRILFRFSQFGKTKSSEWAERGLNAIHVMEKLAGWPLTRAKIVEIEGSGQFGVYCRASRRWIKSSYLITMYILLMRMCKDDRIVGFKDANGLIKTIESIPKLVQDESQVRSTYQYWKAMVVGYPELFRQYKITYYWDVNKLAGESGYGEGIYRLCTGGTKFPKIYDKLKEIRTQLEKK